MMGKGKSQAWHKVEEDLVSGKGFHSVGDLADNFQERLRRDKD